MNYSELVKKRREHRLTISDVNLILNSVGFVTLLLDTKLEHSDRKWYCRREFEEQLEYVDYFAYIKFYTDGTDSAPFALVGGKTHSRFKRIKGGYSNSDVSFSTEIDENAIHKDKAKKFLKQNSKKGYRWYCEKVMIVFRAASYNNAGDSINPKVLLNTKQSESDALDIEREILGLLNLYSS